MKAMPYSFCAIFLLFFIATGTFAQSNKSKKLFTDAEKAFQEKSYAQTIQLCKEIISSESNYSDAEFLLGKSYYYAYDFIGAKDHFVTLLSRSGYKNNELNYMLGLTYKALSDYESSKPLFEKYISNTSESNARLKGEVELEGVKLAMENDEPETDFNFKNAGNQLNTPNSEIGIGIVPNSKKIVISREINKDKKRTDNIKYLHSQGWMKVDDGDEFDFLNSTGAEESGTFDAGLKNYYFTYCETEGNNCQIKWSRNVDGIWQKAVPMPSASFPAEFNYKDPFISGDTLFFSSDKRGGLGGMDIWFSVRNSQGFWTIPINLGEPVNTPFDEISPFVNNNGSFYFSSNGHPGYGLYDIFYVEGLNGNRSIHNLGLPFNSSLDDIQFKMSNGNGFISSNRPGGLGGFDIYSFEEVVKKEVLVVVANEEIEEQIYSVLFSSKLYKLKPKFIETELQSYTGLNMLKRQEIETRASDAYDALSKEKISKFINDDKILLASLSKEDKFFVDRMAAAYFEDERSMALNINDEDAAFYQSIETSEKRKLFRLSLAVVNDLKGGFDPTAKVESKPKEKPATTFKTAAVAEVVVQEEKPPVEISVEPEEIPVEVRDETPEEEAVTEVKIQPQQDDLAMLEMANSEEEIIVKTEPVRTREVKQNDETFTSMLGVNSSVSFYQNLVFADKKRVDRIMAIRLVNEKYTLNPGLSIQDREYFNTLPQKEKDAVERLKLYFRSWNKNKEFANLKDYDLQYLASLPQEKRDQVARIIVRRGIGVDDENYIQFNSTDWNKYKTFSESEVTMIKNVAALLKENQQFFDVALAYAGDNYTFNNNLAYLSNSQPVASTTRSSDPELPIKGTKLTYESIYFDAGEYALRKEALMALNELLDIYQQNPEISFALEAYSYEKGNGPANIQLSTLRTNSAKTYLINKGVPDTKIQERALSATLNSGNQQSMKSLENRKLDVSILNSPNVFQSDYTTYMVQPGNTLFSLSKANGTSIDELMALNGLDNTTLYAYQPLRVKKTATLNPDYMVETSQELVYNPSNVTVKNLSSIEDVEDEILADESEVASAEVKEENKDLRGGTMMVIDVTESSVKAQRIHIVEKGEKLEDIAREYGTNVPAIMKNNNLKKPKVKKGQRLKII